MKKCEMRYLLSLPVILAILLIIPMAVSAQHGSGNDDIGARMGQELSNTDDILNRAHEIVNLCRNERGQELLKLAHWLQQEAKERASGNPLMGFRLTNQAREKAREAIKACQQADENESLVGRQLERTDRKIEQIRQVSSGLRHDRFDSAFETARNNQRKAREFFHNRQLRPALMLSRQAGKTLDKLIELLRAGKNIQARLGNQFQQFETSRERFRTMLQECDNEQAVELAQQSQEAFNEAMNFYNRGEYIQAENAFQIARRLQREAAKLCNQAGNLIRKMNQLKSQMEQSESSIMTSRNEQAIKLMKEAFRYMNQAEKACNNGESEICAANIKAAQLSFQKAKRLAGL